MDKNRSSWTVETDLTEQDLSENLFLKSNHYHEVLALQLNKDYFNCFVSDKNLTFSNKEKARDMGLSEEQRMEHYRNYNSCQLLYMKQEMYLKETNNKITQQFPEYDFTLPFCISQYITTGFKIIDYIALRKKIERQFEYVDGDRHFNRKLSLYDNIVNIFNKDIAEDIDKCIGNLEYITH